MSLFSKSNKAEQSDSSTTSAETEQTAPLKVDESLSDEKKDDVTPPYAQESLAKVIPTEAAPEVASAEPSCGNGTPMTGQNQELFCTYTIDVQDVPARLEVYSVQTNPLTQLYSEVDFEFTCTESSVKLPLS